MPLLDWIAEVPGSVLWQWQQCAIVATKAAQVPLQELDWFLRELTELDQLSLRLGTYQQFPQVKLKVHWEDLQSLWQQRLQNRLPVQYLAGQTPWRNFSLMVTPDVLIPRSETELLVDLAAELVSQVPARALGHWADLGTGSGAIALGLATVLPEAQIHGVEMSLAALAIAQENVNQYGLGDRIHLYAGSWFEPLDALGGQLSGMVSNPPYIPTAMLADLPPEVAFHEPDLALNGGADGLDCLRHLVMTAPSYLLPGGFWLVEVMAGQAQAVAQLLQAQGTYTNIQIHPDLSKIDRFVSAVFCGLV